MGKNAFSHSHSRVNAAGKSVGNILCLSQNVIFLHDLSYLHETTLSSSGTPILSGLVGWIYLISKYCLGT